MRIAKLIKYNHLISTNKLISNNNEYKQMIFNKRFFNYDNWYKGKDYYRLNYLIFDNEKI
jgi:hypothetical protein